MRAAVVDLFSRYVVCWEMTAQLVTYAFMAIWRRGKPDSLLHHSDQGSQYTREQFQPLMADHGIICSMSRSDNVRHNVAMESFFIAEIRAGSPQRLQHGGAARADGFDYIKRSENRRRRHSTRRYLSPVKFEEQARLV